MFCLALNLTGLPRWHSDKEPTCQRRRRRKLGFDLWAGKVPWRRKWQPSSIQFSSVTQSCPTLCDPMNCSTPGFPVLCYLLEFAQTYVHWVSDAIQPSHPLSSPSPAFNLSQHQRLFQWVSSSHQVANVLELQLQHQSFQRIFRADYLQDYCLGNPMDREAQWATVHGVTKSRTWLSNRAQTLKIFCFVSFFLRV